MRQLKIDMSELAAAFDNANELVSYYLDVETGELVFVTEETASLRESIYEEYYDKQSKTVDWVKAFEEEGIHDWQQDAVLDAERVEAGFGDRFIRVPSEGSHEGYNDMEAFIDTVSAPRLQERLEQAIQGRGAFRRFKDVLLDFPAERERWFGFKSERQQQRVREWLESIEIIPL
jgi:hypothetical protein